MAFLWGGAKIQQWHWNYHDAFDLWCAVHLIQYVTYAQLNIREWEYQLLHTTEGWSKFIRAFKINQIKVMNW